MATIVLSLFAVGYSAMARHITATGAFYGFISHGLGRVVGMAAGSLTTLAYVVFEASLAGIFAFFASTFAEQHLGVTAPWIVFALLMLAANAVLTYFDVNLTAKVLGVFLVTEIAMLALMAGSVVVSGGGPEGWSLGSLNPLNAFQNLSGSVPDPAQPGATLAVAGSAGIGLFFAFCRLARLQRRARAAPGVPPPRRSDPRPHPAVLAHAAAPTGDRERHR